MTASDKIWATVGYIGKHDTRVRGEFDTEPSEKAIPYVPLALAQAAVAAAYEAAARTIDTLGDSAVTEALGTRLCCDGRMCGCQGADVGAYILDHIRALATPDQIAALAAKVDASQAPNPAVNGGRCQSDTITLPLEDVKALMEAARAFQMIRAVWTDPHNDNLMRKASMTLDALRERMK